MVAHVCQGAPQEQVWGRHSMPPPGKRRSPWPWVRETLGKQDSLPWNAQQAGGKTSVTRNHTERWKPACEGDMRRRLGKGRVLHSEEGVWAEDRPVLCLRSQRESISLATCPKGRLGLATRFQTRNSRNNPMEKRAVRCYLPPRCGSIVGGRGVPGQEWRQSRTVHHHSARAVCRDPVASSLLW